jgi:hypothetical protein
VRGRDGVPPVKPETIAAWQNHTDRIRAVAQRLRPHVESMLELRSLYSLKATHITWARQLVPTDAVFRQVGHSDGSIEWKHYLDVGLVDARQSPLAVWEVLNGWRKLPSEASPEERWRSSVHAQPAQVMAIGRP